MGRNITSSRTSPRTRCSMILTVGLDLLGSFMKNKLSGELDITLDLEDIGMCLNKSLDNNIHMVEKTTQTESFPMSSPLELEGTPNGTTSCNHPSMSCQVRQPEGFQPVKHDCSFFSRSCWISPRTTTRPNHQGLSSTSQNTNTVPLTTWRRGWTPRRNRKASTTCTAISML